MKRRNSETPHEYADHFFAEKKIYDIQGLLRENEVYTAGVESYTYSDENPLDFNLLNQEEEIARYKFCKYLNIPYYIIGIKTGTEIFEIYEVTCENDQIKFKLQTKLSKEDFILWWKERQSFTQKKEMTEAAPRIQDSIIDKILFANGLAWGVNIDGFTLDNNGVPNGIFEKRITAKSTVENYDPAKYFFGTPTKSGDFPSWRILINLANQLSIPLYLTTFEKTERKIMGITKVTGVDQKLGLTYSQPIKIIKDNLDHVSAEIKKTEK